MGMPKHKRWVLIANYLDNSFMRNEMAFYLSEQVGLDWTVHGEFVDLVLNGKYKGLYWLGEARLNRLQEKITVFEEKLYPDFTAGMDTNNCAEPDESYSEVLDIDSWAKFWFVNEIMNNGELGHPKSCYFTFDSANNIFKAGLVWDFDWAALGQACSCVLKNTIYYNALFKSPTFKARAKELWGESYAHIDISTQIEAMRKQIYVAQQYDTMLWGVHNDPSNIVRADFNAYMDFLKETLEKKQAVVNADVNDL